jgi:DNA-binding response OmpR family regulator
VTDHKTSQSVMIVDDDEFIRKILVDILNNEGFKTIPVESAEAAFSALEKVVPDVFIVDIILPGQDGFEFCEVLRRSRKTKTKPILILSSKHTVKDRVRGLQIGADDYIVKPFHLEELVARIHALLRRYGDGKVEKTVDQKIETTTLKVPESTDSVAVKKEQAMKFFKNRMFKESLQVWELLYRKNPKDLEVKRYVEITRTQLMKMYLEVLIGKNEIPVRITTSPDKLIGLDLNTEEGFIFSRIDGQTDLKSIVAMSGMSAIRAYDVLFNLCKSGVIRIKES